MLVLAIREGESITIGENITAVIVSVRGKQVRLGISAPTDIAITRNRKQRALVPRSRVRKIYIPKP